MATKPPTKKRLRKATSALSGTKYPKSNASQLARVIPKIVKQMGLTPAQTLKLKNYGKGKRRLTSSDELRAAAQYIKEQKYQSKGPVGTKLRKRSILKWAIKRY